MQQFTTSVTQKGQVTLPKALRDRYGITPWSKVIVLGDDNGIQIKPTEDIIHLAGSLKPQKGKSVMAAREAIEKRYDRV